MGIRFFSPLQFFTEDKDLLRDDVLFQSARNGYTPFFLPLINYELLHLNFPCL